jgi:hypothetical protein
MSSWRISSNHRSLTTGQESYSQHPVRQSLRSTSSWEIGWKISTGNIQQWSSLTIECNSAALRDYDAQTRTHFWVYKEHVWLGLITTPQTKEQHCDLPTSQERQAVMSRLHIGSQIWDYISWLMCKERPTRGFGCIVYIGKLCKNTGCRFGQHL